jgi:hypothetical protein
MINISKIRKFPTYAETRKFVYNNENDTDKYFVYKLTKKEIGDYLNIWFVGSNIICKKTSVKFGIVKGDIIRDELWTVKKVDTETASHLYNKKYNTISLNFYLPTGGFKNSEKLYTFSAIIHSVDDSSYTAFFHNHTIENINILREKLISFINEYVVLNGDVFIKKCEELGCDEIGYD